jgi:putative protease
LARELSLDEIGEMRVNLPTGCELEMFVHGAMCVSYSGRCLLSNYLTGRDANRGDCAQPCRWPYAVMETSREGQYMPVVENKAGAFIFNARDLCLIEHIDKLMDIGIDSFKIEGRVKSEYYAATVTKAYREAIDRYCRDGEGYVFDTKLLDEVCKVSHRPYSTGFLFGAPAQEPSHAGYIRDYELTGIVIDYDERTGVAIIQQRNRFYSSDAIEVLQPKGCFFTQTVGPIKTLDGEELSVCPHPMMKVKIKLDKPAAVGAIIRKRIVKSGG